MYLLHCFQLGIVILQTNFPICFCPDGSPLVCYFKGVTGEEERGEKKGRMEKISKKEKLVWSKMKQTKEKIKGENGIDSRIERSEAGKE